MGKQNPNITTGKTVKSTIPSNMAKALEAIANRSGRVESDVIRSAMEYYIKQNYPEFLPRSTLETENEVKAKYDFEKTYEKYKQEQYLIENIPVWENIVKQASNKIEEKKKDIEKVEGQLRVIGIGKEKEPLEEKLKNLNDKLQSLEQQKSHYEQTLELAEKGETLGA